MASHPQTPDDLLQPTLGMLAARFPQQRIALPGGSEVAVRVCGQRTTRPAVLLLHGISSGAASWLHTALPLVEHTQVIAWDAPGYGDSTPLPAAAPTDADYAARLAALVQAMDVGPCVVVGHSLGALMAAAYAARPAAASPVRRLVLISPARGYGLAAQAATREQVRANRLAALESKGVAGLASGIAERLLSPQADTLARAWVSWNTARLHAAGYRQAVELLCQSALGRHPHTGPTEVHCGDADVVTPPASCRDWAEAHGASFALIDSAGHASPVEQPAAVAQLILAALRQAPTPTP